MSESDPFQESKTLPTAEIVTPENRDPERDEGSLEDRLRIALGEEYELGAQIGRGGMGIVFRAMDKRLKREVAVKVLPPEVTYRGDLRKRFVREAQVAASLTHPNLVPIYDVGTGNGLVWFVMAFINGESVRDLVRRTGPQPSNVVTRILRETAWALSYAHARGIVHRDIKPDNIMIDRASGRAVVMDFGLAKIRTDDHTVLTSAGGVIGTPSYMSPEQARGDDEVDPRTDIYSLGLVGYYMLAGRNPFQARSQQAALARVLTESAPNVMNARPGLPGWLGEAIRKATQRDAEKRHETAEALANELDQGDTTADIPTSVENFLRIVQGYVELSILMSWMLFILGVPRLPTGTWLLVATMLSIPLLNSIHLISAEGLGWPEVRTALTTRRLHWLRTISLQREAGFNWTIIILLSVTIIGLFLNWFFERWTVSLNNSNGPFPQFVPLGAQENDDNPWAPSWSFVARPVEVTRPFFLFIYAFIASLTWGRIFGLPRARRMTPARLDAVASWHVPASMDFAGRLLFSKIRGVGRIIRPTADFEEMTEPAVQAVMAFHRVRNSLSWPAAWRLREPISLGKLVSRRLWQTYNRWIALRARYDAMGPEKKNEKLERAIEKRESIISECISVLESLRNSIEDNASPSGFATGQGDKHAIDEARRLTGAIRAITYVNRGYLAACAVWVVVNLSVQVGGIEILRGFYLPEWLGPVQHMVSDVLIYSLLFVFIPFQFIKSRFYT